MHTFWHFHPFVDQSVSDKADFLNRALNSGCSLGGY